MTRFCNCIGDCAKPETVLYLTRLAIAALFFVWGMDKIVNPGHAAKVFDQFYNMNLDAGASYLFGVLQVALSLAFLYGINKKWSYGAVLVLHAVSTFATLPQLLHPLESGNQLFVAGGVLLLPMLGLFMARDNDTILTYQTGLSKNKIKTMGERAYTWQYGVYTWGLSTGILWSILLYLLTIHKGYGIRCYMSVSIPLFLLGGFFLGRVMYQAQTKTKTKSKAKKKK